MIMIAVTEIIYSHEREGRRGTVLWTGFYLFWGPNREERAGNEGVRVTKATVSSDY